LQRANVFKSGDEIAGDPDSRPGPEANARRFRTEKLRPWPNRTLLGDALSGASSQVPRGRRVQGHARVKSV